MKNVIIPLVAIVIMSVFAAFKYFDNGPNVKPGQKWIRVDDPNPFENPDTMYFEVLAVKDGYVKSNVRFSDSKGSIIAVTKQRHFKYNQLVK